MRRSSMENTNNLPVLEGFDLNIAMEILQSEEVVNIILVEFDDFLDGIVPKLNGVYSDNMSDEDIQRYIIDVHALKSSAATVGAMELSELAKSQEMTAKNGHMEQIREQHPIVLEQVAKIKNVLHEYVLSRM